MRHSSLIRRDSLALNWVLLLLGVLVRILALVGIISADAQSNLDTLCSLLISHPSQDNLYTLDIYCSYFYYLEVCGVLQIEEILWVLAPMGIIMAFLSSDSTTSSQVIPGSFNGSFKSFCSWSHINLRRKVSETVYMISLLVLMRRDAARRPYSLPSCYQSHC